MSRNLCIDNRHVSSESSKSSCWPDPDKGAHTLEESRFFLSLLDEALFSNREETPSKDNRTAISQMSRLIDAVGRMVELPPSLSAETLRKLAANRGFDAVCECLLDALADACTCLYSVDDEDHQNMKRLRATSVLCLGAIAHLSTALLGECAELNGNGTDTPPALLQTVQILHDLMLVLPKLTASNASGELEYENELPYANETKPVSAKVQRMPDPHELVSHEAPYHESIPALAETDPVGETMGAGDSGDLGLAEVLVIQDSIAEMCESFWKHNWVDRHLIAPHMIIFLLHLALGKYGDIDIPPAVVAEKELAVMETHNQGSGDGRTWRLRHASLREDALRRLYEVRHAFFCLPVDQTTGSLSEIDGEDQGCCLTEPSETSLISDFVSAFEDLFVVQNVYGRKWLALCLSGVVSESLTDALHTSFKERLIFHLQGKRIMQHYAEMYFRAWCIANAAAKEGEIYIRSKLHFERVCLQDFAEKSILTISPRLVRICRRILTAFHAQKRLPGVDHALACCYEPIIYRAMLRSTNPVVRRNACHLFFEAFPILREDGSSTSPDTRASGPQNIDAEHDGDPTALSANAIEEAEATEDVDTQLARQFSLLPRMLLDSSPKVRKISVEGTCRLLSVFWELFPPVMRTQLLQLLTGELAFDMCSSAVRESVCKSIRGLLETQTLAHPTLRAGILARLRPCLHDRNRNVQHAAAELVLTVSRAPDLRWYDFVSLQEDLLPYLAAGDTMDGRLTCLLLPSFFSGLDADLDGELDPPRYAGVLARCLEFVRVHAEAASNFYASLGSLSTHLPLWASKFPSLRVPCLRSICKFIVVLGNGLVELDEDFRDESGEQIESDAGVTYARELAAPLFVILCDTYRGIAPVVYNGENEDCRSYLERLLPVHTLFALVDALPAAESGALHSDMIESKAVTHLWKLLSSVPRPLVDDLSEDCLRSVSEALRSRAPCDRVIPAVEALVRWGHSAELLGSRIVCQRLSELLEAQIDSEECVSCMSSIATLCEWIFFQPALGRSIAGDSRAMRSCRALQTLLTRFLDANESIRDPVRVAAADLLARVLLFIGLMEDSALSKIRPKCHGMDAHNLESCAGTYHVGSETVRVLLDTYRWALSSVTDDHALPLLREQGAAYISEAITLCSMQAGVLDETFTAHLLEFLRDSSAIFSCRIAWYLLHCRGNHNPNISAGFATEELLRGVVNLVMDVVDRGFLSETHVSPENPAENLNGEQMLMRRSILRLLRQLLVKRRYLFITILIPRWINVLREQYTAECDHGTVVPLESIWEVPRYGSILKVLFERNRNLLYPYLEQCSQEVVTLAADAVAEILLELKDPCRAKLIVSNPCEVVTRLQVLCACAAHGGLSVEKLATVETCLAEVSASRSLLSVLRLRVARASRS